MSAIEEQVRRSLETYATVPQPPPDLADAAIGRARTMGRRRLLAGATATVTAMAVLFGGLAVVSLTAAGDDRRIPSASPALSRVQPVAVWRKDGTLTLANNGRVYRLPGVGVIDWVVAVPDGWLYSGESGPTRLLRPDGSTRELIPTARPAVSADGRRLAWVVGDRMEAGRLDRGALTPIGHATVPVRSTTLAWLGNVVGVRLAYGSPEYGLWDPAGGFVPGWDPGVQPLYGPFPAGVPMVAFIPSPGSGDACLVRVNGADLTLGARVCDPGLIAGGHESVLSPDGSLLAEIRATDPDGIPVVDVASLAVVWHCTGTWPLMWETTTRLLVLTKEGGANRCGGGVPEESVSGLQVPPPDYVGTVPGYGVRS